MVRTPAPPRIALRLQGEGLGTARKTNAHDSRTVATQVIAAGGYVKGDLVELLGRVNVSGFVASASLSVVGGARDLPEGQADEREFRDGAITPVDCLLTVFAYHAFGIVISRIRGRLENLVSRHQCQSRPGILRDNRPEGRVRFRSVVSATRAARQGGTCSREHHDQRVSIERVEV